MLNDWGGGSYPDTAAGVQHVADQDWDVGNLDGDSGSQVLKDAREYATDNGVLLVGAASGSGPCSSCVGYPAAYPEVVAVSATRGKVFNASVRVRTMTLESSVTVTSDDDAVTFEYTVENAGDAPEELTFRSGLSADFAVSDGNREVWRASEGQMFTQALRTESVDAGDARTFSETWDDPDPGDYTVVATLNAAGVDAEARADFSV